MCNVMVSIALAWPLFLLKLCNNYDKAIIDLVVKWDHGDAATFASLPDVTKTAAKDSANDLIQATMFIA